VKKIDHLERMVRRWREDELKAFSQHAQAINGLAELVEGAREVQCSILTDLEKITRQVKFLTDLQEPNGSIEIKTAEEVEADRKAREELAKEVAEAKAKIPPPVQCKMSLVKKGDPKPKMKRASVPRQIVDYLMRIGVDTFVLTQDVKAAILGNDAVAKGGGHFSRSVKRLEALDLIVIDEDTDSIALTGFGHTQHGFCWFTLKDYEKLIQQ
jgi:hypothetical protein